MTENKFDLREREEGKLTSRTERMERRSLVVMTVLVKEFGQIFFSSPRSSRYLCLGFKEVSSKSRRESDRG